VTSITVHEPQSCDMAKTWWPMSVLHLAPARLSKLRIPLQMEIYVNLRLITTFSIFRFSSSDLIIRAYFAHIAASIAAIDDVTNKTTHRIFTTSL